MESECKVILNVSPSVEEGGQGTQSVKTFQTSRLTMALTAFTLCLVTGATVFLFFNARVKGEESDKDSFDFHHTLRQMSNMRAAIHLEGKHDPNLGTSVKWMNQVGQSHSQGGLELRNNEIVIPQNGLYFVYSQASFRVSCNSGDDDDDEKHSMVHLSHTVRRWSSSFGSNNERSYQTILHSVRTACQNTASSDADSVGSWYSAVYMGAVFHLRRGDRLKTVMDEKMLDKLEDEPGKTFFGVFAL